MITTTQEATAKDLATNFLRFRQAFEQNCVGCWTSTEDHWKVFRQDYNPDIWDEAWEIIAEKLGICHVCGVPTTDVVLPQTQSDQQRIEFLKKMLGNAFVQGDAVHLYFDDATRHYLVVVGRDLCGSDVDLRRALDLACKQS